MVFCLRDRDKNNDIYIIGNATSHSGEKNGAKYWKNEVINSLADTLQGSGPLGLAFHADDIFIAGYKQISTDVFAPTYWQNGVAKTLNYPLPYGSASMATGLAFKGDDLYVIGNALSGTAAYWKNGTPTQLKGNGDKGAFALGITIK